MTIPNDTDPETMRVWIEMWRRASPQRRLAAALGTSEQVIALSKRAIAQQHPHWSVRRVGVEFVRLHYGESLARVVAQRLGIHDEPAD